MAYLEVFYVSLGWRAHEPEQIRRILGVAGLGKRHWLIAWNTAFRRCKEESGNRFLPNASLCVNGGGRDIQSDKGKWFSVL